MSEGHDLVPLAPRGEVNLSAAWQLSRVLKRLIPDVIHAYDPHAVTMASTARQGFWCLRAITWQWRRS
jgi:hypothetical protein